MNQILLTREQLKSFGVPKKKQKMGESRNDLLAWLNDLSQLGYTKIEQCGSGVAYCVIIDSIYRDVLCFSHKTGSLEQSQIPSET